MKLSQWASKARALKSQVNDLLRNPPNRKSDWLRKELVEVGIKLVNHIKIAPMKFLQKNIQKCMMM